MPHISKRRKAFDSKVDRNKTYPAMDALKLIKETATAKFDEAVDVAVNLGIDPKKGEQTVRGSVVLPAGTGKKVRVAVFAPGDKAQAAKAAGADIVGMEDLAEQIKAGKMDFDVVIAAPEAMRVVGQLGQILGPRGLMPKRDFFEEAISVEHDGDRRESRSVVALGTAVRRNEDFGLLLARAAVKDRRSRRA